MTTEIILGIIIVILLVSIFVLFMRLTRAGESTRERSREMEYFSEFQKTLHTQQAESFKMLQTQMSHLKSEINDFSKTVDNKLYQTGRDMKDQVTLQFGESQKLIKSITEELEQVKETNRQVFGVTEQLQNLEKVLKHQKQRGNLGEASLELTLSSMLSPTQYSLQYGFKDGKTVDAIIKTKEGFIPVDAKFSLDNYNRVVNEKDEVQKQVLEKEFKNDLKARIDETAKYIRPEEGTLPFAFMFIPAEGIYYDLLVNEVGAVKVNTRNLIDYAYNEKKVMIVSPTTFSAYLMSVLYGFKAFKIEEQASEIITRVGELKKHLNAYDEYFKKVGNALGTTVNHYNAAAKELKKVDKDIVKIDGTKDGILEPLFLEKPSVGEE
jgi:DNA recombination protein RmuC